MFRFALTSSEKLKEKRVQKWRTLKKLHGDLLSGILKRGDIFLGYFFRKKGFSYFLGAKKCRRLQQKNAVFASHCCSTGHLRRHQHLQSTLYKHTQHLHSLITLTSYLADASNERTPTNDARFQDSHPASRRRVQAVIPLRQGMILGS